MMNYFTLNPALDIVCWVVVWILFFSNWYSIKKEKEMFATNYYVLWLVMVGISLFYRPDEGDFWGYLDEFENTRVGRTERWEDFYNWLLVVVRENYLMWRFVIWGVAGALFCAIYKLLKCPSSYATVGFLAFGLVNYYSSRDSLGIALLLLGIVMLVLADNYHKTYYILGCVFVFASLYLHKSMPTYVVVALLALIFPFKKKYLLWSMVAFPVIYVLTYKFADSFIEMFIVAEKYSESAKEFLDSTEVTSMTDLGIISLLIQFAPFLFIYYAGLDLLESSNVTNKRMMSVFLLMSYIIAYVSFLFLGQGSFFLQMRFWKRAMIPFAFFIVLFYKHFNNTKQFKIFVFLLCVYWSFRLFQIAYYYV